MKRARKLVKRAAGTSAFRLLVSSIEALPYRDSNLLRVLTYHRVATCEDRPDLDPSLISASPDAFARQMKWLTEDFHPVSLQQVLEVSRTGTKLPRRSVLVTFDDAYTDFKSHAWPVLNQLSIPATLFVPTAFPDTKTSFWWDKLHLAINRSATSKAEIQTRFGDYSVDGKRERWRTFKSLKGQLKSLQQVDIDDEISRICGQMPITEDIEPSVLSWTELSELSAQGVALVPHTASHPLLTRIPEDQIRCELNESRQALVSRIGQEVQPAFAYPSGYFDENVESLVRECGFELCFTTCRGINDLEKGEFLRLRRINVGSTTPDPLIRLQMCPASLKFQGQTPHRFPRDS